MPDASNFDESLRAALEAAADAMMSTRSPPTASSSSSSSSAATLLPSSLARSPAFFEALCLLCRHAAPLEVVRAAAKGDDDDEDEERAAEEAAEEEDEPPPPRSQRLLLAALAAARALRGAAPRGYEARVLQEAAKQFSSVLSDELASALASSLLLGAEKEEVEEEGGDGEGERHRAFPPSQQPLQLQAFFFGLEEEDEANATLSSTRAFPVAVSSSADLLSGGTGMALWPASRALAAFLLSEGGEESAKNAGISVRGRRVTELGCGVGMVGAALRVGAAWWRRRMQGRESPGDDDGEREGALSSFSPPLSLRLTDGDPDSVANARRTLEANGVDTETDKLRVGVLDWLKAEEEEEDFSSAAPALVVGSDIMYDPGSAQALSRVLASLLRENADEEEEEEGGGKGGEEKQPGAKNAAVLAGVVRSGQTAAAFERAFAAAGLSFSSSDGEPPKTRAAKESGASSSSLRRRRVRAWHSGDVGVKIRWWVLRKN